MSLKGFGAILIIAGCSCFGTSLIYGHKREVQLLKELIKSLNFMENMLQFNLCPLPELCRQTGKQAHGTVQEIFSNLARELDWQIAPDVYSCMCEAISKSQAITTRIKPYFLQLGTSLGQFDLVGQVRELASIRNCCEQELQLLTQNQDNRLRSCQTLCICSGIALAILFI